MTDFIMGAGWRICAVVERVFAAPSGKFAEMTLAYPDRGKTAKSKVCAFDAEMVQRVASIGQGETVQVTGGFWNTKLTNKAKQPIQVDGRDVYDTKLVIRTLTVEGAAKAVPGKDADLDNTDLPF